MALCATLDATAQAAYPVRPVTIVVPYPPGGSNDVFARQVARGLAEQLGQPVVIDNKPGASGNIGTALVAKAPPDGHTLAAVSSSMTTNAAIQTQPPFDAATAFAPVAQFAKGPFIVAVNNGFSARTIAEMLARFAAQPGKFNYGSSGTGSSNQFATELLKSMSRTYIVHVPYRGMGPAVADLIGNQVQLLIASGPSLLPHIRAGRMRALAITSPARSPVAPELAPVAEVLPGYAFELWWGLLAPAGTSSEIVERLNAAVNRVTSGAELRRFFLAEGAETTQSSAAAYAAVIANDIPRWRELARRQSITPE